MLLMKLRNLMKIKVNDIIIIKQVLSKKREYTHIHTCTQKGLVFFLSFGSIGFVERIAPFPNFSLPNLFPPLSSKNPRLLFLLLLYTPCIMYLFYSLILRYFKKVTNKEQKKTPRWPLLGNCLYAFIGE